VRYHITGAGNGIKGCKSATAADRDLAASFERKGCKRPPPAPAEKLTLRANPWSGVGSSSQLVPTPEEAAVAAAADLADRRDASLMGMFKHMQTAAERSRLNQLWAVAFGSAGLPTTVIDNEHFRAAIIETSLANAPYTPPHRTAFNKEVKLYNVRLDNEMREMQKNAVCRVLGMDGWDDRLRNPLIAVALYGEDGDEFLDHENMTGRDKDVQAHVDVALKFIKRVASRYPPRECGGLLGRLPSVFGVCTDNPTVMRAARALLMKLLLADPDIFQPFFFEWPCLLHGLSLLLLDI
jgi:hypothetical protein